MAGVALTFSQIQYGYFFSDNLEDVENYIHAVLKQYKESIIVRFHVSNSFYDPKGQRSILIHQSRKRIQIHTLDPTFKTIPVQEWADHALDPDYFEDHEGSGFMLEPNTTRYWFKIYPCQPNPTPNESIMDRQRVEDSNLLESIFRYLLVSRNLPKCLMKEPTLSEKFRETEYFHDIDFEKHYHAHDLRSLHLTVFKDLNIGVFTQYGNLWYIKTLNKDTEDYCFLRLTLDGRFDYIRDINKFFRQKKEQTILPQMLSLAHEHHYLWRT